MLQPSRVQRPVTRVGITCPSVLKRSAAAVVRAAADLCSSQWMLRRTGSSKSVSCARAWSGMRRCVVRNASLSAATNSTGGANGAGSEIVNAQSRAAPCKCTVKSRPPYHFQPRPRGHWAGPPHALYEQYGCRPSHGATLASSVMGGAAPAVSPCSGTADLAIDSVSVLSAGGVMRPTASPIGVIRVT